MRSSVARPKLRPSEAAALVGTFATRALVDRILDDPERSERVLKPDGSPLAIVVRRALPLNSLEVAFEALRHGARASLNRGSAGGRGTDGETGGRLRKLDGTVSRTRIASRVVRSGIVGYFDRTARTPFCRATAFTAEDPLRWARIVPALLEIDRVFRENEPDRYSIQRAAADRVSPDFRIEGTAFSTVTVNRNWRTAIHFDAGDFPRGFGVMTLRRAGVFEGGELAFPRFGVAVRLWTGDVLLADVHEAHGNLPIRARAGDWERLSLVLYLRERMLRCGTAAEEVARARSLNYRGRDAAETES